MRTDETIFLYTQPCVSGRARKTNRLLRRSVSRPRDIREYRKGFSRPIVCRNRSDTGHTPRKLPRFHEQSPASSHNTPVLSHTRLISIAVTRLYVNSFFGIITEKFALFLCRAMIFVNRSPSFCAQRGTAGCGYARPAQASAPTIIPYYYNINACFNSAGCAAGRGCGRRGRQIPPPSPHGGA